MVKKRICTIIGLKTVYEPHGPTARRRRRRTYKSSWHRFIIHQPVGGGEWPKGEWYRHYVTKLFYYYCPEHIVTDDRLLFFI